MCALLYCGAVIKRPQIWLSVALSLDGYMDDAAPLPRVFSDQQDRAAVDQLRAQSDAILVGANTIRCDDPKLLVRSEELRRERVSQGKPEHPIKVTLTRSAELDPQGQFFCAGTPRKIVFAPVSAQGKLRAQLKSAAQIEPLSESPAEAIDSMIERLAGLGVEVLMVEGGAQIHNAFLSSGKFDRLRIAWAPLFLGQAGRAPFAAGLLQARSNLSLSKVEQVGGLCVAWFENVRAGR